MSNLVQSMLNTVVSSYLLLRSLSWRSAGFILRDHDEGLHGVWGGRLRMGVQRWSGTAAQQIRQGMWGLCWGGMTALSRGPGGDVTRKHAASPQRLTTTAPSDGNLGRNWCLRHNKLQNKKINAENNCKSYKHL